MVLNPQTDCHGTEVLCSGVRAIKMQSSTKTKEKNICYPAVMHAFDETNIVAFETE